MPPPARRSAADTPTAAGPREGDLSTSVGTIGRAMLVLDCVGRRGPIKLSDIARRTRLPKSTVHRLLAILEMHSAVRRVGVGYVLGDMTRQLSAGGDKPHHNALRRVLMPHVAELYEATRLPTSLAVLDELTVVCLVTLYPRNLAGPVLRSPERIPVHRTALGKVLLAYSPGGPQRPPEPELSRIRSSGIAFNAREHIAGMAGIAAPVVDPPGGLAAIAVAGPAEQLSGTDVEPLLRRTAHEAVLTLRRHRLRAI